MVKIVVTSILRLRHRGIARPACHSWKWAMIAVSRQREANWGQQTSLTRSYLSKEPRNNVTKDDRLVRLVVIRRRRDAGHVPKISLPLVHPVIAAGRVKQEDTGGALDEPPAVDVLDTSLLHRRKRLCERGSGLTANVSSATPGSLTAPRTRPPWAQSCSSRGR